MLSYILEKWQRVQYLYYGIGFKDMTLRIAQKIISPLYQHEVGYIIVRNVQARDPLVPQSGVKDNVGTECIILETLESLRCVECEIPSPITVNKLKSHLVHGSESIIVLARRPNSTGSGNEVVGYRTCQRGIFFTPWLKKSLSSDILFVLDTEVLPQYRGQRIQHIIRAATYEYCQINGLKKICGVVLAHNRPSIVAHTRASEEKIAVGTVELVSVFGGLFKWVTPWEKIKIALENSGR